MFGLLSVLSVAAASYSERLELRPLARGSALATFEFEMAQPLAESGAGAGVTSYTAFPRSLGQIMAHSHAAELHLRFGQGHWDARAWGAAPAGGSASGGIGVELWAWIEGESEADAWANWRRLTHALGGYFCASVNFIDETVTTFPSEQIHTPWGQVGGSTWLMRGALPAEPICTENLTPFLKLLPCRGKAGLASLLDGHTLFKSRWQTMSVDAWRTDDAGDAGQAGQAGISLRQTVANVVDTDRCDAAALPWAVPKQELNCDTSKPWANDYTCFPSVPLHAEFSLAQMFGQGVQGRCAAADSTEIVVEAPSNWEVVSTASTASPGIDGAETAENADGVALPRRITHLGESSLDFTLRTADAASVTPPDAPGLLLDRSFSGWGQQHGGIRTVFTNPGDAALHVAYLETLPWFMRAYLHTTQTRGAGCVAAQRYVPSQDRGRPSQLELELELPPHARLELEYRFDKSLLALEEYPPDANHGFEVPPGVAVARRVSPNTAGSGANTTTSRTAEHYEVRTSSLLLTLPVPDFSMPYNVIILTSTVMAMAFATLFNLLSREVVPEEQLPKAGASKLGALRQKVRRLVGRA